MKNKPRSFFSTALVSLLAAVALGACNSTPTPNPPPTPTLQGNWSGQVKSGTTSFQSSATLTDSGGIIAGTLTICPLGICETSTSLSGNRNGTNVSLTVGFASGYQLNVNATLSGSNIAGTWSDTDSDTGQITMNKSN